MTRLVSVRALSVRTVAIACLGLGLCLPAFANFLVLPVPVGNSPIAPEDVVELATNTSVAPGFSADMRRINNNGINAGNFTVPPGKVLVLQSIQLYPETFGGGKLNVQLVQNALVRNFWVLPQSQPSFIPLSPGLVVAAGFSLDIANGAVSGANVRAIAYGYLADE